MIVPYNGLHKLRNTHLIVFLQLFLVPLSKVFKEYFINRIIKMKKYQLMQKIQRTFKFFDAFGVPLTLKVEPTENYYKSSIGGLTTLIIYILSILYASYILNQWFSNQMSPKISQMLYQSDFSKLNLNYSIFQMNYYPVVPENIDPIKENILTLVLVGSDYTITPIISNQVSRANTSLLEFNQGITVYNKNGTPKGNQGSQLAIIQCVNAFMPKGTKCADQQTIQKFFKQQNNLFIFTYQSYVLDMDGNPQSSIQRHTIRIEQSLTYQLNINLLSNYYVIKDNLFTDTSREVEYLSGAQVDGQTNTIEYTNKIFGQLTAFATFFVTLQAQQTKVIIEFPHIGEILAQIGSIIQVLFLIRYLINLINYDKLWDDLITQTMSFYYPQLSSITYEYNYFNRIKSVSYRNNKIDTDQFLQFRQDLRDKIEHKLTFNNLIYEISRLYFVIRALSNTNLLRSSHNMGIQFEFSNDELGLISQRSNSLGDDLEMISLMRRQQNMDQINDEIIMQEFTPKNRSDIS